MKSVTIQISSTQMAVTVLVKLKMATPVLEAQIQLLMSAMSNLMLSSFPLVKITL